MNLRVWIKSRAADRVLAPLRDELLALLPADGRVLEVGCGTGDLLRKSSTKIAHGLGVDTDCAMIDFAEQERQRMQLDNLTFRCMNALAVKEQQFDVATSTLCLHEMPATLACETLAFMLEVAETVVIADYTRARSRAGRLSMELDEMISGHYGHYRRYRRAGEIPAYAERVNASVLQTTASVIDGIHIWKVGQKS